MRDTSPRVAPCHQHLPLIAGETVKPPGGWSSWPPHRHEHEEVYLYRFDPAQGFGISMSYGERGVWCLLCGKPRTCSASMFAPFLAHVPKVSFHACELAAECSFRGRF